MDAGSPVSFSRPPSVAGSRLDEDLKAVDLEDVPLTPTSSNEQPLWHAQKNDLPKPPPTALAATDRGFHLWGAKNLVSLKKSTSDRRTATYVKLPSTGTNLLTFHEKMTYKTAQHLLQADLIDEFFGDRSGNRRALLPCSTGICDFNPNAGKTKNIKKEPKTLARTLFWHGFWLFPLWFWGMLLLLFPRTAKHTDSFDTEKAMDGVRCIFCREPTPREVEKKWALRCLAAVITFICLLAFAVFLYLELTSHHVSYSDDSFTFLPS